jgi:hypothetical protein
MCSRRRHEPDGDDESDGAVHGLDGSSASRPRVAPEHDRVGAAARKL